MSEKQQVFKLTLTKTPLDHVEIANIEEWDDEKLFLNQLIPEKDRVRNQTWVILTDHNHNVIGCSEVCLINPSTGNLNTQDVLRLAIVANASTFSLHSIRQNSVDPEIRGATTNQENEIFKEFFICGEKVGIPFNDYTFAGPTGSDLISVIHNGDYT